MQDRPAAGYTKEDYILAVLDSIDAFHERCKGVSGATQLQVRLLLSIERSEAAAAAQDTVSAHVLYTRKHILCYKFAPLTVYMRHVACS
jgi:hypothetical protein